MRRVVAAGLLTVRTGVTAGLLIGARAGAMRETCGRAMWLGQETGHNLVVGRPATTWFAPANHVIPLHCDLLVIR